MISKAFHQIVFKASKSLGSLEVTGGIVSNKHSKSTPVFYSLQFISGSELVTAGAS